MGLIKAGMGALGGTLADQWKEFFYCDALPNDVLMRKGEKRVSGRSSNTKGNDNIISNGSAPNPANLHTTAPPSRLFSPEVSETVSRIHSR